MNNNSVNTEATKSVLAITKQIQKDATASELWLPSAEGIPARGEMVLAKSLTTGTRKYIEIVVNQINGAYENGLYDACAVMIRRLVETLIIEAFEQHGIASSIKDPRTGDYFYLKDLITRTLLETKWTLGRNAKAALPNLKDIGDLSAHSRRYYAHRKDIDDIKRDLRVVTQELLSIAGLK